MSEQNTQPDLPKLGGTGHARLPAGLTDAAEHEKAQPVSVFCAKCGCDLVNGTPEQRKAHAQMCEAADGT